LDPNSISLQSDAGELIVQGLVGGLGVDLNSNSLRPCTQNFRESFQLNADLDDQNIEADFYDGTLQITIPRLFSENQDEFESMLVH
jgi:HSP20 family molecular chaperone IbpA